MKVLLINLDSESERRACVERSFEDAKFSPSWDLERISATSVNDISEDQVPGVITIAEKACFKSHLRCIERAADIEGHVLIAEDDVQFSKLSERMIDRALKALTDLPWDILYTDIGFVSVGDMVEIFQLRRQLTANNSWRLLNLQNNMFIGATSYIINAASKHKVRNVLSTDIPLDAPWDIFLRAAIHSAKLNAYVIFPFATSLSPFCNVSQIQPGSTAAAYLSWNAFRQLIWVDADLQSVDASLKDVAGDRGDLRSVLFAKILANCLSDNFVRK